MLHRLFKQKKKSAWINKSGIARPVPSITEGVRRGQGSTKEEWGSPFLGKSHNP